MRKSSTCSLYALISKIYVPLLRQGDKGVENEKDNQLRDLLYSLRAGLHKSIRKGGTNMVKFEFTLNEFRGVLEPLDEIDIWQEFEKEKVEMNEEN